VQPRARFLAGLQPKGPPRERRLSLRGHWGVIAVLTADLQRAFRQEYGFRFVSCRSEGCYGPFCTPERLIGT
jgi:hypothetical protein